MKLNELRDNPGARKTRTRVGRGIGSGKGKTGGRGMKGQKSRSGVAIKGFEGGQMPLYRRLPKRGFSSVNKKQFELVNVGRLQAAIDDKRLDAKKAITIEALQSAGLVNDKIHDGVKLLAKGELNTKIKIEVTFASAGAVKVVEAAGGSVTLSAAPVAKSESKSDGDEAAE